MKIGKLVYLLLAAVSLAACSSQQLTGRKLYSLNANLDAISLAEYEMHFLSSDKVQLTQSYYCNSYQCISSDDDGTTKSPIRSYTFKDGFLTIEGLPGSTRLSFGSGGEIITQDGYQLFASSVKDASTEERKARLMDVFKGRENFVPLFLRLLNNGKGKGVIERKDGKIILHNVGEQGTSFQKQPVSRAATSLFAFTSPEALIAQFGKENIHKQKAYGDENEDLGYKYVLFKGLEKEAVFYFNKEGVEQITFARKGAYWQLPYNLSIEASIQEVAQINKGDFEVVGFEVDGGGRVVDWKGGKLETANVGMRFEVAAEDFPQELYYSFMSAFHASTKGADQLGIKVQEITLYSPTIQ